MCINNIKIRVLVSIQYSVIVQYWFVYVVIVIVVDKLFSILFNKHLMVE